MRRPWIKIETATPDKPEICSISTALRMDSDAVLGKLVRLWAWVEVNRIHSDNLGVTKEFLDKLVGRKGFASALIACGWLVDKDGKLGLRNLQRHNGGSAKVRALTAQRVALHRRRKQIAELSSVSEALPVGKAEDDAKLQPQGDDDRRTDDHATGREEAVYASLESERESVDVPPSERAAALPAPESELAAELPPVEPEVPAVVEPVAEEAEKQPPGRRRRAVEDPDQAMLF